MASWQDDIANIKHSQQSQARSAADSAQSMRSIEFTSGVSAMANTFTAANSIRQARAQEEQAAIQQQMAEQNARHNFAMWRQTAEGKFYLEWRDRAQTLLPLLSGRRALWENAWQRFAERVSSQVPSDEQDRYRRWQQAEAEERDYQEKSTPRRKTVRWTGRGCCLVPLTGIILGLIAGLVFGQGLGIDQDSTVAEPILLLILVGCTAPLWLPVILRRRKLARLEQLREAARQDQQARINHWGVDPLAPAQRPYTWCAEPSLQWRYPGEVKRYLDHGPEEQPMPSQLPPLIIPEPRTPHSSRPPEVNEVLQQFSEENAAFSR